VCHAPNPVKSWSICYSNLLAQSDKEGVTRPGPALGQSGPDIYGQRPLADQSPQISVMAAALAAKIGLRSLKICAGRGLEPKKSAALSARWYLDASVQLFA
jgi:hypothetical protein